MMNEPKKLKRIAIYIPEGDYQKLRAKLILRGKNVSGWFRDLVKDFINQ